MAGTNDNIQLPFDAQGAEATRSGNQEGLLTGDEDCTGMLELQPEKEV